ncbi:ArsR/SmtB family transcription factor [Methanobacterium ferruginis]|uniref:ArsR/SmtB family transcription factor n=1 Tax=Methanobacterium ferruginis TaxID=710191 RepID=UPI00330654C3
MIPILKAIGNPGRLKILILLWNGPLNFRTLLDEMDLKKSALANHLTQLKNTGLIEKIQHGTYCLSDDGKKYIYTIGNVFKESKKMKMKRKEIEQRKNLTMSFLERK